MDKYRQKLAKIAFWVCLDPIVEKEIQCNWSIKKLSNIYTLYAACSNNIDQDLELGKMTKIIKTPNIMQLKGIEVLKAAQKDNIQILIRIDADCIVYNISKLINLAYTINPDEIGGVPEFVNDIKINMKMKSSNATQIRIKYPQIGHFVFGAAQILGKNVIHTPIEYIDQFKDNEFDIPFCGQLLNKFRIIHIPTLEIGRTYTNSAPVWHPPCEDGKWQKQYYFHLINS